VACIRPQVYNTGRALDKWEQLIAEKRGILAPPDALILSVGTKVQSSVASRGGDIDSSEGCVEGLLMRRRRFAQCQMRTLN